VLGLALGLGNGLLGKTTIVRRCELGLRDGLLGKATDKWLSHAVPACPFTMWGRVTCRCG